MRTSDFDYELPRELIATHPADQRDQSRLLVLARDSGSISHRRFSDLPEYLQPGDLLVMNDSRVMKARLHGTRPATGAGLEVLLLSPLREYADSTTTTWTGFCRPAKKFRVGETITFADGSLIAEVAAEGTDGERTLTFHTPDLMPWLEKYGEIPLPPYIVQRRKEVDASAAEAAAPPFDDSERYQTVYARESGSVAAPTAGLHFTPQLLESLQSRGVSLAWVTLHVGAGTFKPVEVDNPSTHPMHTELYEIPAETAALISKTRQAGGRVVAVGTTTVRALESGWDCEAGQFSTGLQSTRLMILPGYNFNVVNSLVTNFHLPRSSLLMMVSALASHENIMNAYNDAILQRYRFYSYGDAMLIN